MNIVLVSGCKQIFVQSVQRADTQVTETNGPVSCRNLYLPVGSCWEIWRIFWLTMCCNMFTFTLIDINDIMIFKSQFACNFQVKRVFFSASLTWIQTPDENQFYKCVSSLNTILPTYWMVKYKHECAFCLIWCTGVKCLYTWLLLQYCGQPGVLLHHSHRGAVQQSKWKHQAGHQGQGGCMTETLDFYYFYSDEQETFIYGVF